MIKTNIFLAPAGKAKYVGQVLWNPPNNSVPDNSVTNSSTNKKIMFTRTKGQVPFDNTIENIVLLDVSGSMGQNVNRIITDYLPEALTRVNFNDKLKIVTFTDRAAILDYTIQQMKSSRQSCEGQTYMSTGIMKMREIIYPSKSKKFRIIALSDGELNDTDQTVAAADDLALLFKSKGALVSCTALRLYTSSASPDTKGLSSILKCATQSQKNDIIDLNANQRDVIIDTIASCFEDNLGSTAQLTASKAILLQTPWSEPTKEIYLIDGQNTFWVTDISTEDVFRVNHEGNLQDTSLEFGNKLDFTSYNTILKDKVEYFMKRLRILKVVNTDEAKNEIELIVQYFTQLEKCFAMSEPSSVDLLSNHKLHSRMAFFREVAKKKSRSVAIQMSEVANDDKVSQLNSAQQAEYLRSASASTNSRSLAKRAIGQGLNFNEIAHKEVAEMKKHLHEIADIDDSGHYVSFYSQETTLQGIKTVCDLIDNDNSLEQMSAVEILQLLNIVGIPCRGPVGDFPDPKTYHLSEIMLGSFVSLSDVMVVKDSGHVLRDPYATDEHGERKEILNVVPFYDDDRIQQFLMKYAPTLLEYTASIGMRNMIMNVPHTYKYTIVGGVWNMVQRLDTEKTNVNVDVFCKLVRTYNTAVDGIFDHVVPLFKEQSEEEKKCALSFYIQNNGTTNMIAPFITVMEQLHNGKGEKAKYIPDALSALYSFEIYQSTRKIHKSDSDKLEKRQALLNELLGIDFTKFATPIPKHFELPSNNVKHHNTPNINLQMFTDLCNRVYWVDKIALIPSFILNSFKGAEGQKAIMETPALTKKFIEETVGVKFTIPDWCPNSFEKLDVFKFFCMVQSFLFDSKADRVTQKGPNGETPKMKIQDCRNLRAMEKMVSDYVEKQYRAHYQSELDKKEKEERFMLAEELVEMMASTNDVDTFAKLFKEGFKRNHVSVHIYDTYQLGFALLKTKLFDSQTFVPLRKEKLWMLVMATRSATDNDIIWNKGNVLRTSLLELNEGFSQVGLSDYWIKEMFPKYKEKNVYLYRDSDKANRHSHCNSKTSYWAYGYSTVGKYFADITEAERQEYLKIHTHCCGIWDGVLVKLA